MNDNKGLNYEFDLISSCLSQLKTFEFKIEELKNLKSFYQSKGQLLDTADCLINIAMMHFYRGEISQSYHYAEEALDLIENLIQKNQLNLGKNSIIPIISYVRILTNFAGINIYMGLCDSAIEIFEKINNLTVLINIDSDSKLYISHYIQEQFFSFCNQMNIEYYGSDMYIFLKSFNFLFTGFQKLLKNENTEYFLKCLKESINNLGILDAQSTNSSQNFQSSRTTRSLSVPLINLSLVNLIRDEKKLSKEVFKEFLNQFDTQITEEEIENFYFKIINEHFQKYETAKIIFEKFQKFINKAEEEDKNKNFDHHYCNKSLVFIETLMKLIVNKLKNQVYDEHNKTDMDLFANSIIYCNHNSICRSQFHDISSNLVSKYIRNLFNNLLIIYKKSKLKFSFTKFMKRTLTFTNIKDYRNYLKKSIIDPKIKKFHYSCLDSFESRGFPVTKFNFSSSGKKEKFIKFGKEENCIMFSTNSKFNKISKKIKLDEISNVVYGLATKNLKNKYLEFQRDKYKKPWLFLSLIVGSKNYNYTSVDLFFENENDLKQILYSFNLVKYVYGLENIKIYRNSNFILMKLKLKMIHRIKEHYRTKWGVENSLKELYIESCWSFTKIFLYIIKNKLNI
jgi:hypothetical protein